MVKSSILEASNVKLRIWVFPWQGVKGLLLGSESAPTTLTATRRHLLQTKALNVFNAPEEWEKDSSQLVKRRKGSTGAAQ